MHVIIEGIRHCGKKAVIDMLQNEYGGYVYNCGNPPVLDIYKSFSLEHQAPEHIEDKKKYQEKDYPQYLYQKQFLENFSTNIRLTKDDMRYHIWYNTFHLSDYVYGHLERQYTQSMMDTIFKLERCVMKSMNSDYNGVHLILLLMNHPEERKSKEETFDKTSSYLEQSLFIDAFNKSSLPKSIVFSDSKVGGAGLCNPAITARHIAKILGLDKKWSE